MAVNSNETHCEQIPSKTFSSTNSSKVCNLQPYRSMKTNVTADDNMSIPNKRRKSKKFKDFKSPYLTDDRILLHSQVTEERLVLKKAKGIISSFNLAANIYKANSDEFKSMKRNKKVKKSVLTLPNKQAPAPQTCTVSDFNDSEYDSKNIMPRMKKKLPLQNNRKSRVKTNRDFEFYDRDAKYCSQMNIHLDCSSTDMFKHPNGDGNTLSKRSPIAKDSTTDYDSGNMHDVWAVLRNINRFQFRPSPPMSEESVRSPKKKKTMNKKRNKRKDTRVIETCRTEEFAYISSIEVDSKSTTNISQSSSFDRITVIDNQDKFDEISQEIEERFSQIRSSAKSPKNKKSLNQNKLTSQQNRKSLKTDAKTFKAKENNDQRALGDSKDEFDFDQIPNIQNMNIETYVALAENTDTERNRKNTSPERFNSNSLQSPQNQNTVTRENEIGQFSKSYVKNCKGIIDHYDEFKDNLITEKEKVTGEDSGQPIKGITKVVLSKGQNIALSKRLELQKKNTRLMNIMPKAIMSPKLTQTEIKRQLGNLKFPLVVLGKDQVSSTIQVINHDPPQFDGLDKQIWPFMLEWSDNKSKNDESSELCPELIDFKTRVQKHVEVDIPDEFIKDRKIVHAIVPNKQLNVKNRIIDSIQNKNKLELKRPLVLADNNVKLQAKTPKPIRQIKDKVIKLLYKKPSFKNFAEDGLGDDYSRIVSPSNVSTHKINASRDTFIESVITKDSNNSPPLIFRRKPISQYPWSKAKRASDFIDTVIKKIKNGVYYNQRTKDMDQKPKIGPKEASIQTKQASCTCVSNTTCCDSQNLETASSLFTENLDSMDTIPGFDNSLPVLEIKTLNMNQIEVKHSVTNIMVQFDVKVPTEPEHVLNVKKSSSVIAMKVTDSNTQIFKCKTSILNAILPAELCSMLPKMLHRIMKANVKSVSPPLLANKTGSNLSTISEIASERRFSSLSLILNPTYIYITPEIRSLTEGMFSNAIRRRSNYSLPKLTILRICLGMDLLPKLSRNIMCNCDKYPISLITPAIQQISVSHTKERAFCTNTALVPYTGIKQSMLISTIKPHDFMNVIKKFSINHHINNNEIILRNSSIQMNCALNNISMNMTVSNCFDGFKTNVCIDLSKFNLNSLFNWFQKAFINHNEPSHELDKNDSKFMNHIDINKCQAKEIVKMDYYKKRVYKSKNKMRRKGFVKLSRKYKSSSDMCSEKCTSLSKILNLEDFLDVIGTGRHLAIVFDDRIGKKILSSLAEMKSWISEINPQQAMLILLLMNKKDTPNLVRYRPLLLQGIAVNRITRGTELDMEIEVIETENLSKISQYEGISYLEETVENHDNLLEELYWIAKTTASDYQKPFDESSENLLRSLLEKRKKLNPSYLRVMARYVGLGLLKSPIKTNNK